MKTLTFSIKINATPDKVWHCLWEPENYKTWTRIFSEGSYYKTDLFIEGSKIHFLTPEGHGMYSVIDKLDENSYMAFRHLGEIMDFKEQSVETATWTNAMETYELNPVKNGTKLTVNVDTVEEYVDHMNKLFPPALDELKRISEVK
ncbi:SRPBCC domain-containing protein [Galbibacter sp. EGI 63066]|uniref:SRPBCC family protein n=1 Tax=Galbibacter sp. EGI 63066 TaxID=2993559 RepID=UPI0022492615|nr:SRPBCC domain-containing protein [Galbibacter sp. EGI 63066]MCX2679146.1 SRPBCC domain-containing protein [Galbibacter sp. EGI 63066]